MSKKNILLKIPTSSFGNDEDTQLKPRGLLMRAKTILFSPINAAREAYDILQPMIDVVLDCNAITYNSLDEETVRWLIEDDYYEVGARAKIYPYSVKAIALTENTIIYQYNELQIEHKYLPPDDWEFTTRNSVGEIIDKTWWGYEDGRISVEIYIENFIVSSVIFK
jgi:hypothetical protein